MVRSWLISLLLFSATAVAQTARPNLAEIQRLDAEINEISAYCKGITAFQRSTPPQMFVSWAPGAAVWERLEVAQQHGKGQNYVAAAKVWMKDGYLVAVQLWSRDDSRRGIQHTDYCYRENGSLARVRVIPAAARQRQNLLHSEIVIGRDILFREDGTEVRSNPPFDPDRLDPRVFQSEKTTYRRLGPSSVYRSVDQLPFVNLIFKPV